MAFYVQSNLKVNDFLCAEKKLMTSYVQSKNEWLYVCRVMYDDDVFGARVMAEQILTEEDEGEEPHIYCNHLIAIQTKWVIFWLPAWELLNPSIKGKSQFLLVKWLTQVLHYMLSVRWVFVLIYPIVCIERTQEIF